MQADRERPSDGRAGAAKNTAKIFEKLFKNLLTNRKECGIITKSPTSDLRQKPRGSLTIEQQEIKVQAKLVIENLEISLKKEISNLSRIRDILNKV